MTEDNGKGESVLDYCQSTRRQCPGGRREVWRYPNEQGSLLLCRKCWPHRQAIVTAGSYRRRKEGNV